MSRTSGNISNTNAYTMTAWIKRTSNFSGMKHVCSMRPTNDSTGHDLVCNDPGQAAYAFNLQANYATAQAVSDDPLALNTWTFIAIVGSGANISFKYWDGSAIVTETVGQTSFVPGKLYFGDAGAGTSYITALMGHIRFWNAALNDTELATEKDSATRVRTTNFLSAHSGEGGSIATALAGEFGTAFTNAGAVTYDADTPSFSSFSGPIISGEALMPSDALVEAGTRYNRLLYSGTLSNAVWSKQTNELVSGATVAPTNYGTSQRVLMKVNTGGVYQLMTGLPVGRSVATMCVRRVDADYVVMRHTNSTFSTGSQGFFSFLTNAWTNTSNFGGTGIDSSFGSRSLGNGWYLIYISSAILGDRILEFYPTITTTQVPAIGKSIDVCGFQYEDVLDSNIVSTFHKPTTSAVVARSLTTINVSLSIDTIGTAQTTTATAQLLDGSGDPWDQYRPVDFDSSDETKATVASTSGQYTDLSGRISVLVSAVANGTTDISASSGSVSSTGVELTVSGTAIANYIEILVEAGWESTTNWFVGIYEKHSTARFPDTKLFEASGQSFQAALASGQSRMLVAVPSSVSVTEDQIVECVLENDNIDGKAVDGPGIFAAVVI